MKEILILFGSPNKQGITDKIVQGLVKELEEEATWIYPYEMNVSPCIGCKGCRKEIKCIYKDEMETIYNKLDKVDGVIIASPTYFYGLTGPLKTVIDRLQPYWEDRIRGGTRKKKVGIGVFTGGAPKFQEQFMGMELTVKGVFREINTEYLGSICVSDTDKQEKIQWSVVEEETKQIKEKFKKALENQG